MKSRLAIFDMDGTLFDTCRVNFESYEKALGEEGVVLTDGYYAEKCFGRKYSDFLPELLGNDPLRIERVHDEKLRLYHECLSGARKNDFLFDYIDSLAESCHTALVTTASKTNVFEMLEHFGVSDRFELILTQEDIVKSKPDPEGFLKAMEHFGIEPSDTVIFEDSDTGIEAAMRSGAAVMRVMKF